MSAAEQFKLSWQLFLCAIASLIKVCMDGQQREHSQWKYKATACNCLPDSELCFLCQVSTQDLPVFLLEEIKCMQTPFQERPQVYYNAVPIRCQGT